MTSPPEGTGDGTLVGGAPVIVTPLVVGDGPVDRLDGHAFARVLRAGALAVARQQEALNRINVFPVRDADTGANLAATFRAAAARLGDDSPLEVGAAARVAADAALDGARGNSGAIVAQFFHGMAAALTSRVNVGTSEFAAAAHRGSEAAYKALQNPREGTILSVLRAWAHSLSTHSASVEDFRELLTRGLGSARQALANTPKQLEVLAKSHVVDAGGQGFVYFLEGAQEWLRGGQEVEWTPVEAPPHGAAPLVAAHEEIDERFRYCTEALLARVAGRPLLDREAVMKVVGGLGESLVVAGGDDRLRVHIHTNEPQRFLEAVAAFGTLERTKIDDMVLQQLNAREATIAIVSDSTCDLPEKTAFELGVVRVPLTVSFGDEDYLDGVDMTLDGFVRRLKAADTLPTSSQPPVADFRDTYRHLLEYREGVVSVHIAAAQSGTSESAAVAAREVDPRRIRVIDSRTNSVGSGLLIEAVGEMIAGGLSLDEIESRANEMRARHHRLRHRPYPRFRRTRRPRRQPRRAHHRRPAPQAADRVRRDGQGWEGRRRPRRSRRPRQPGAARGEVRRRSAGALHGRAHRRRGGGGLRRRAAARTLRPRRRPRSALRGGADRPRRPGLRFGRRPSPARLTPRVPRR